MREIKFRGFDRKTNHMFPIHELIFDRTRDELHTFYGYDDWDKDGYTRNGGGPNKLTGNGDGITFKRFEIMQYTGLKDKNGVEIYEGDVMPVNGQNCYVVYSEEYARYCLQMKSGRMFIPSKNSEVIGNIYEHQHLLGGDSECP